MSRLNTTPVFRCRHCGEFVTFAVVETAQSDPEGEKLSEISANLHKIAVCSSCRKKQKYAQENPGMPFNLSAPNKTPVRILRIGHE